MSCLFVDGARNWVQHHCTVSDSYCNADLRVLNYLNFYKNYSNEVIGYVAL